MPDNEVTATLLDLSRKMLAFGDRLEDLAERVARIEENAR